MAIPINALFFMGALATLATLGLFVDFGDEETRVVLGFVASIIWGVFAVSAFNVQPWENADPQAVMSLVYLGVGFAVGTFLLTLYALLTRVGREAQATSADQIMR